MKVDHIEFVDDNGNIKIYSKKDYFDNIEYIISWIIRNDKWINRIGSCFLGHLFHRKYYSKGIYVVVEDSDISSKILLYLDNGKIVSINEIVSTCLMMYSREDLKDIYEIDYKLNDFYMYLETAAFYVTNNGFVEEEYVGYSGYNNSELDTAVVFRLDLREVNDVVRKLKRGWLSHYFIDWNRCR